MSYKLVLKRTASSISQLTMKQTAALCRVQSDRKMSMRSIEEKFKMPSRYAGQTKNVWVEYIQLGQEYNPVNLGQGFPNFAPPKFVTDALEKVSKSNNPLIHQYARGYGHLRLVNALSKLYSKLIGREINPLTEILVTNGGYEALFSTILGHVDDGDEVIIIEPFFDCYEPMVRAAGGVPKFIPLRFQPKDCSKPASSGDWVLNPKELEGLFNAKTKAIILNTPHNPLGKVFTLQELEFIADLCKKWNVLCISDEVYEWMIYAPNKHIRMATLPDMWERTITIGTAGKAFSVTGWKTGWAYGPPNLIRHLQLVHQNCVYACCTPIQEAVAICFETALERLDSPDSYFVSLARELESKRDFVVKFLTEAGMKPTVPEGGFFIIADWSALESKVDLSTETDEHKDYRFTKWMTRNLGLLGIPPTAFYSEEHKPLGETLVRYCFIKNDDLLTQAADILKNCSWKTKGFYH